MKITLYPPLSIHEIGQRDNQEDSIAQWDNRLFVLCDGMGGHEKGEVASQTVCQSFVSWFEEHIDPDEPFTDDQLRVAIEHAYAELDKFADDNPRQMGTTLTLLYIHSQGVTAAHIGDSRIYHIRPFLGNRQGEKYFHLYVSRDHSLVFDLFQAGEITYEEMRNYPQKNIVTRAMTPGEDNRMRPDIIHITDIKDGDWFYLCSDGLLERINTNYLTALLSSRSESDEQKLQFIIEATSKSQDNHSGWFIRVKEVTSEPNDETLVNEEPTARCNAINIIPQSVSEPDDDVVIVKEAPKKKSFQQRLKQLILSIISRKK